MGHFTRAGSPLRGVTLGLDCGYNEPYFGLRGKTDSTGAFVFDAVLSFPQDQALADGNQFKCSLKHSFTGLIPDTSQILTFGPVSSPAPVSRLEWELPEPSFRPARAVGQRRELNDLVVLPGTAAFRAGVFETPQAVSLEIRPRPSVIVTPQYGDRVPRGDFLPVAVRVSTGRKAPSTGSTIYLLVPHEFAAKMLRSSPVRAFARVPRSTDPSQDDYLYVASSYNRILHLLEIEVWPRYFTDLRNPDHWFEALIVVEIVP